MSVIFKFIKNYVVFFALVCLFAFADYLLVYKSISLFPGIGIEWSFILFSAFFLLLIWGYLFFRVVREGSVFDVALATKENKRLAAAATVTYVGWLWISLYYAITCVGKYCGLLIGYHLPFLIFLYPLEFLVNSLDKFFPETFHLLFLGTLNLVAFYACTRFGLLLLRKIIRWLYTPSR